MDKTKIAVALFNKCAQLYSEKYMDVSLYKKSLDLLCQSLPQQAEILELACGPGNITAYLLKQRPDLKILATDLAPNMIEIAAAQCKAEFQLLDCRNLAALNRKFNAIVCGFALPYLNKEEAIGLIAQASDVLNRNGMIYLSTMEGDYGKSGLEKSSTGDEIYMHYHEAAYLIKALEEKNFGVVAVERKKTEVNNKSFTDLIIIAIKHSKKKMPRWDILFFFFVCFFISRLVVVFGCVLKFFNAASKAFHKFRNFFTSKKQQYNCQYNEDFCNAQSSHSMMICCRGNIMNSDKGI